MSTRHEIIKKVIESKAVDFNAIGKLVGELGPSLALSDDPWENFCGTMRRFIHIYRRPYPGADLPIENLDKLGEIAR